MSSKTKSVEIRSSSTCSTTSSVGNNSIANDYDDDDDDDDGFCSLMAMKNLSKAALEESELSDVVLTGCDGIRTSAVKFVLSAHSKVFRKMFYGSFKEGDCTNHEVQLQFRGNVLRAVYTLCCGYGVNELRTIICTGHDVVELYSAGHYFELPIVEDAVIHLTRLFLLKAPWLACEIYNDTSDDVSSTPEIQQLHSYALQIIRNNPEKALLPPDPLGHDDDDDDEEEGTKQQWKGGGVTCLSPERLGQIINDNQIVVKEIFMFHALEKWANANEILENEDEVPTCANGKHDNGDDADNDSTSCGYVVNARFNIAKEQLIGLIDLSCIKASDLLGCVRESGLIPEGPIWKALLQTSIKAEKAGYTVEEFREERKRILDTQRKAKVIVKDAGSEEVNGIYYEDDGLFNGVPKYSRKGTYYTSNSNNNNGNKNTLTSTTFYLWKYTSTSTWYFSITPSDRPLANDLDMNEIDFYRSKCDNHRDVPTNNWKCTGQGKNPPPSVQYIAAAPATDTAAGPSTTTRTSLPPSSKAKLRRQIRNYY